MTPPILALAQRYVSAQFRLEPDLGDTQQFALAVLAMWPVIEAAMTLRDGDGPEEFPRSDLWNAIDTYRKANP